MTRAKKKSPAFQFYPADFMTDGNQILMELDEAGAYTRLMCVCWIEGAIPKNLRLMGKFCGATPARMKRMWPALEPCFREHPSDPSLLVHPRLEKERVKQTQFRKRKSKAGKKGAKRRWKNKNDRQQQSALDQENHGSAIPPAMEVPMTPDSSSSLSSSVDAPLPSSAGNGKSAPPDRRPSRGQSPAEGAPPAKGARQFAELLPGFPDAVAVLVRMRHLGGVAQTATVLRARFLYPDGEEVPLPEPKLKGRSLEERRRMVATALLELAEKGNREWGSRALTGFLRDPAGTPLRGGSRKRRVAADGTILSA